MTKRPSKPTPLRKGARRRPRSTHKVRWRPQDEDRRRQTSRRPFGQSRIDLAVLDGRDILIRQEKEGWGAKVIDRLADDLGRAFPEMTGLSARNLKYMRAFAEAWPDSEFVQQVVALLPWGHNVRLLDALKAPEQRAWYARQAIEHGWSRNVLVHQIDSNLFARQGSALTNFSRTLPAD
ncbi:DUF1016 N-terminal domain-containing protein [Bradyrhizobium glycinis]|uniref:DUF1016 N-terminal domain-containing protein n=1 Tax=Bradyrhizobium glycinis TaxID=2751812 RepID=UPI001FE541A2|nr:DUF1016 N-terminal domain-containing protein [Bradyrhizobium glycinis]